MKRKERANQLGSAGGSVRADCLPATAFPRGLRCRSATGGAAQVFAMVPGASSLGTKTW